MRKQLIIKIPKYASSSEIKAIVEMQTQSYGYNYPLYMYPGWEYEVVEISEPPYVITQNKNTNTEELVKAMRNIKSTVATEEE